MRPPPPAGVSRAGDSQPREGGIRTCPVSPQARLPPPGHGKEREGRRARRPDAGFSPASPRRNWDSGGAAGQGSALPGSSRPLRKRRPLPTRVAPTWGFLTLTGSVFSCGFCRLLSPPTRQPPAAPLGLDSWGSATPFHVRARGARHSRLDRTVSPLQPPRGAIFPRQSPLFYNSSPMTQYSRFLRDSLASSTGPRLRARALFFYVPKQNTSGLVFRTLSAPLPFSLLFFFFNNFASLPFSSQCIARGSTVTPQMPLSSVRLAPSGSEPTRVYLAVLGSSPPSFPVPGSLLSIS